MARLVNVLLTFDCFLFSVCTLGKSFAGTDMTGVAYSGQDAADRFIGTARFKNAAAVTHMRIITGSAGSAIHPSIHRQSQVARYAGVTKERL